MSSPVVFFDFGGTLVESLTDLRAVFQAAGRRAGLDVPWSGYLQANERIWEELWPEAASWIGRRPSFADTVHLHALHAVGARGPLEEMIESIREEATSPRWHRPYPETEEVLRELHERKIATHLVSNNVDYLPILLANLGWAERFASVTYSQEIAVSKPDPRLFHLALERAGCSAEEATFVGDSWEADVIGALPAGLRPVWVNRSGGPARGRVPMIRDLRGLSALLE